VIDVQGNVLGFSAIDHVLASLVNLLKTIATIGAIFSLQFRKTVQRWESLSAPPDPLLSRYRRPTSKKKGNEGRPWRGREGKRGKRKENPMNVGCYRTKTLIYCCVLGCGSYLTL